MFGMAEDGVDYSKSNTAELTQDIIDQLEEYKAQIIVGRHRRPRGPDQGLIRKADEQR